MNISEGFIKRPIATSLLMLGIAGMGVIAYRALPVSDLPNVDFPTLNVGAGLAGADPGTMASAVASPLERQFTTIAGVDEMTSSSSNGSSNVTLQFDLSRDIDSAAVDVETAIAAVMPLLPAGMPAPPSFRKFNPSDSPIMNLGVISTTVPLSQLDDYAENMIAPRISMVSGVSQVQVYGAAKYAVRVQVDPNKLQSERIGLNEVNDALKNWNVNLPTGQLYGPNRTFNIKANGQLMNAAAFRPLIVAYRDGAPVRLSRIATVKDDVENNMNASWLYNGDVGQRAINLSVMRQPGSNTIAVTDAIRKLMPTFESRLPRSVHLVVRGDRSKNIREAFQDIQWTMLVTLVLVVLVMFAFLHNASATMIPALALPFSILGTVAVMEVAGFSLDNLSMMALILCIGFVVDDAIVMIENVVRHIELGETAFDAALKGSKEIGFTILTMTVSLAAVFIPILFLGGILGRLFREFAVTITTAILISGIVSITLTPMLCSRFLNAAALHAKSGFGLLMERLFNYLLHFYEWSLGVVLRHRPVMLAVFVAVFAATIEMFVIVPKGFVPDEDNDSLNINLHAAQGTSFYDMSDWAQKVSGIVGKNPNVESFFVSTGGGFASMNTARLNLQLLPRRQRKATAQEVAQQLRRELIDFPAFQAYVSLPTSLHIGGHGGNSSYNLTVQSADTALLYPWARKLEKALVPLPELQDVSDDMEMRSPRIDLVIDRDKAAEVGLNANDVKSALYDGLGPQWSSTIYGPTSQYRVLLELDPKYQQRADALKGIAFKTASGTLVPLESVVKFKESVGPQTVNHVGQLPAVTISFGLKPGSSLGDAVAHIDETSESLLPPTVTTAFQGSAKTFQESMQNLGLLLVLAIGVVYIVLGMLYESYIHPITILSGLPAAGLGALVTLYVFHNELNIYSFVGLVMLIGIVKKNAIMQIDFALEAERQHGKAPTDAIYEGCLIRFRPIMMTTMAALLGSLPIALGWGAGGESRRPLGLAVVGGLLVSQLITLYLTPVIYTYMASLVKTRRIAAPASNAAPATSS
ncbi:MAG TPA: efflux RND transporter permease subunit [Vicinamibacterales bacterium]|nr:efflux RND transporter permease subunit [Vicinamibacterales bacterium]